jgi:hypothetical protein
MSIKRSSAVAVGFWPHTNPRPAYPGVSEWLTHTAFAIFVAATKCTIATCLLLPLYAWTLGQLRDFGVDSHLGLTILLNLSHTLPYVLVNGLFFLFDALNVLQQYKLPRLEYMHPAGRQRWRGMRVRFNSLGVVLFY